MTQRGPLIRPTLFIIVTECDHPTVNMLLGWCFLWRAKLPDCSRPRAVWFPRQACRTAGGSPKRPADQGEQAGAPSGMQSKAPGSPSAAHPLKILPGLVAAVDQNFLSPPKSPPRSGDL